ncbi:MAG TPA: PepSY domain-containing protein [Bacillota bacterium]|nr:PepSY domain-containing protein [Bacillota bacterium]
MPFLKKLLIILSVSVAVIIGGILITNSLSSAQPLPKDEIHAQLAEMYDSNVEDLILKGNIYEAKVIKDGAEYLVKTNAESGEVLSLTQTKEAPPTQTSEKPEEKPEEDPEKPTNEKQDKEDPAQDKDDTKENDTEKDTEDEEEEKEDPTTLISKEEAIQIALNELPDGLKGEVDDVDFEASTERSYYLVEIDIDTDDELDEVIYEIDAITGEIVSTEWDD